MIFQVKLGVQQGSIDYKIILKNILTASTIISLPTSLTMTDWIGCGHLWDDQQVVAGCSSNHNNYYILATDDVDNLGTFLSGIDLGTGEAGVAECGFNRALNWRNINNSTLIATGNNRHIWEISTSNGFDRITRNVNRLEQTHNRGEAFTLPSGTLTCD